MKRKVLAAALMAAGALGVGIPLAWGANTGAVPIEELTLVEESGGAAPAAAASHRDVRDHRDHRDYRYRDHRDYRYRDHRDYRYRDHRDYRYRDIRDHRDHRDYRYRIHNSAAPGADLPSPRMGTER